MSFGKWAFSSKYVAHYYDQIILYLFHQRIIFTSKIHCSSQYDIWQISNMPSNGKAEVFLGQHSFNTTLSKTPHTIHWETFSPTTAYSSVICLVVSLELFCTILIMCSPLPHLFTTEPVSKHLIMACTLRKTIFTGYIVISISILITFHNFISKGYTIFFLSLVWW